jgi:hypothetical protein
VVEARGLSFLWVKTQLYSYALHDGMLPPSARAEFILRGFETSFHFLEAFSATVAVTPIYLLPALHPFSAVCCWMFVLKTLFSRYRMYLKVSETEQVLVDIQKLMASKSRTQGDFCYRAGIYMDSLLHDAKANDQHLAEPFLGIRSRMAAGLYYDGLARLADLRDPHDVFETKVLTASPPMGFSSLTSSPFLSSDDLSTPPATHIPPEYPIEKPMFSDYWSENQAVENSFIPALPKIDVDWLSADSFSVSEGPFPAGDYSSFVAPGLLMVQ